MQADPLSLPLLQLTGEGQGQPQLLQSYLGAILTDEAAQRELHAVRPEADRDVDEALAWKEYFERARWDSIVAAQRVQRGRRGCARGWVSVCTAESACVGSSSG